MLGFTRAEISLILLGELAVLTCCALPVGAVIGYSLGALIMAGFNNEVYRLSYVVTGRTIAWACLVVIAAAFLSGLSVRRRLDHLDLVAVLKRLERRGSCARSPVVGCSPRWPSWEGYSPWRSGLRRSRLMSASCRAVQLS